MTGKQKAELTKILLRGARASGYANDLWTCPRGLEVIERRFGVTYHVDYVGTLLHKLGWSVQKPEQRARERDEQAIQRWRKEEWPRVKKGDAKENLASFFFDESGFMLQPVRRHTWAPRGQTPIHKAWDRHDRLSVLGALSLAPWALRIGVYFRLYEHNTTSDEVVAFVKQLHRQLGRPLILVWDRWSVHRKAARRLARYTGGLRSSGCPLTPPNSIRSKPFGTTPNAATWPTSSRTIFSICGTPFILPLTPSVTMRTSNTPSFAMQSSSPEGSLAG